MSGTRLHVRGRDIDLLFPQSFPGGPQALQAAFERQEHERRYQRTYCARLRRSLRRSFGNRCWFCGSRRRLQFFHRAPNGLHGEGRGLKNRLLDIRRHPYNYGLACVSCHRRLDGGGPIGSQGLKWYGNQGRERDNPDGGVVA